ncbi:hypothetical protein KP509_21G037000 [Ceratopteris richardii]|uniref:Uncharacterized protein n=1 Tax=Ceratopteris richardii TaxID=49495 RepID=A0A8T2SB39_CERRI|nr:hypothetical protein KP509_21G037000 [Ceratopteris richardii]
MSSFTGISFGEYKTLSSNLLANARDSSIAADEEEYRHRRPQQQWQQRNRERVMVEPGSNRKPHVLNLRSRKTVEYLVRRLPSVEEESPSDLPMSS